MESRVDTDPGTYDGSKDGTSDDDASLEEAFDLGEDVYSLIFVAPICGPTFWFAIYMVLLKLTLFTFLAIDLYNQSGGQFDEKSVLTRATQFFLLPVAVALQEDLIHVYTRIANIRYSPDILEVIPR